MMIHHHLHELHLSRLEFVGPILRIASGNLQVSALHTIHSEIRELREWHPKLGHLLGRSFICCEAILAVWMYYL